MIVNDKSGASRRTQKFIFMYSVAGKKKNIKYKATSDEEVHVVLIIIIYGFVGLLSEYFC